MKVLGVIQMLTAMIATGIIVTEMRGPVRGFQRDLEITVLSFSLRIRPSTNFYQE